MNILNRIKKIEDKSGINREYIVMIGDAPFYENEEGYEEYSKLMTIYEENELYFHNRIFEEHNRGENRNKLVIFLDTDTIKRIAKELHNG